MVRLVLLLILILFIIWILLPFLKTKKSNENDSDLEKILNSDKNNFRYLNATFMVISIAILFALFFWLLPKLGINFFSLFIYIF